MPKLLPFKTAVQNLTKYFADRFGLTNVYDITITYRREPNPHNPDWVASVEYDNKYLRVFISIYPELQKQYEDGNTVALVEALTHEFCHYITDPLYERLMAHTPPSQESELVTLNEHATQRITRAIVPSVPTELYLAQTKTSKRKNNRR